jgi:hypothetical protein
VVRGYLIGSGFKDYKLHGSVCGIALPPGLQMADALPEPIFTPASKAPAGQHDENIDFDAVVKLVGRGNAADIRRIALEIYRFAAEHARARNIIIADTKFEFGIDKAGRLTADRRGADAGLLALLAGRFLQARASARRASTSNSCATTWNRCTGTRSRRRRICRRKFSRAPAIIIVRRSGY